MALSGKNTTGYPATQIYTKRSPFFSNKAAFQIIRTQSYHLVTVLRTDQWGGSRQPRFISYNLNYVTWCKRKGRFWLSEDPHDLQASGSLWMFYADSITISETSLSSALVEVCSIMRGFWSFPLASQMYQTKSPLSLNTGKRYTLAFLTYFQSLVNENTQVIFSVHITDMSNRQNWTMASRMRDLCHISILWFKKSKKTGYC